MSTVATVTKTVERIRARAEARLPQRKVPPVSQRLGFSVLQTGRAPAQLSLFVRAGLATR
jgi:hypothetical protein